MLSTPPGPPSKTTTWLPRSLLPQHSPYLCRTLILSPHGRQTAGAWHSYARRHWARRSMSSARTARGCGAWFAGSTSRALLGRRMAGGSRTCWAESKPTVGATFPQTSLSPAPTAPSAASFTQIHIWRSIGRHGLPMERESRSAPGTGSTSSIPQHAAPAGSAAVGYRPGRHTQARSSPEAASCPRTTQRREYVFARRSRSDASRKGMRPVPHGPQMVRRSRSRSHWINSRHAGSCARVARFGRNPSGSRSGLGRSRRGPRTGERSRSRLVAAAPHVFT